MLMNPVWRHYFKLDIDFASDSKNKDLNELNILRRGNSGGHGAPPGGGGGGGDSGGEAIAIGKATRQVSFVGADSQAETPPVTSQPAPSSPQGSFRGDEPGALAMVLQPAEQALNVML